MKIIDVDEISWSNKLSLDKLGRVFFYEGRCYRAIIRNQEHRVNRLLNSDLFKELEEKEFILPTKIADISLNDSNYGMVLETKRINNIIEPTEWSFSMLLDAAKFLVEFEEILWKYGYILHDHHPYNLMFDYGMKLYFVDLGSIVLKECEDERTFYKAMVEKYYRPLYIWMKTGNSQSTFYVYDRAIDDASWNIFLYGYESTKNGSEKKTEIPDSISELKMLFERLDKDFRQQISGNHLNWQDYQEKMFDENGNTVEYKRFNIVSNYLKQYGIRRITELAANQGAFSQYCLERNIIEYSTAIDVDTKAIDKMYNRIKSGNNKLQILGGVSDIVNPISRDHYQCSERMKNDAVVALALTHHLCIGQGLSVESAIEMISGYTDCWIVIEFMPLGMWDGAGGLNTPYYYNIDNFRNCLSRDFDIVVEEQIEANRILFIGKRK